MFSYSHLHNNLQFLSFILFLWMQSFIKYNVVTVLYLVNSCFSSISLFFPQDIVYQFDIISTLIFRIGPDRAYPLHFTPSQLLLLLQLLQLPQLLQLLCVFETGYSSTIALHFRNVIRKESVCFLYLGPIL